MAEWSVDRDGSRLTIRTTDEGRIAVDIAPAGEPFVVDAAAAQDVRIKIGAAISAVCGQGRVH